MLDRGEVMYGDPILSPRVTSAIVSSTIEHTEMLESDESTKRRKLLLSPGEFRAYLFDCDGTMKKPADE